MKSKRGIPYDSKQIYLTLKNLDGDNEISVTDLVKCVDSNIKAKHVRLLNCINYLCDLGITIAEDEKDGKIYYSLLPSIDNNIVYREHLMNI